MPISSNSAISAMRSTLVPLVLDALPRALVAAAAARLASFFPARRVRCSNSRGLELLAPIGLCLIRMGEGSMEGADRVEAGNI